MKKKQSVAFCAVLVIIAILIPTFTNVYTLTVLALAVTYGIIASGYNILLGYAGLFSFGHMALAGLGGYICLLLMLHLNVPFLAAMFIAVCIVALFAAITAYPALGLKGSFFGISTLAIGESIVLILTNLDGITGGTQGLLLTKNAEIFGWKLVNAEDYYYIALFFFIIVTAGSWYVIRRTHLGKTWIAVRGNEDLTAALGINVKLAKLSGYVAGSAIAALGGCIYMVIMSVLTPEQFTSTRTTEIVMMVLIGGKGSLSGPMVGALLLTWLPQVLNMSPQIRMIVYGIILIVVILGAPSGIIGTMKKRLGGGKNAGNK